MKTEEPVIVQNHFQRSTEISEALSDQKHEAPKQSLLYLLGKHSKEM